MQQVDIFLVPAYTGIGKAQIARYQYILVCGGKTLEGEGTETDVSGHRLTLLCAVEAMKRMRKPSAITIRTDSRYLITGVELMEGWKQAGWSRANGKELRNADLWKELYELQIEHTVRYQYEDMDLYR